MINIVYIHVWRHSVIVVASTKYPAQRLHTTWGFRSQILMMTYGKNGTLVNIFDCMESQYKLGSKWFVHFLRLVWWPTLQMWFGTSKSLNCQCSWLVVLFGVSLPLQSPSTESLSTVHQFDTERRENPPNLLTTRLAGYSDRDAYQHAFPGIHS